MRHLASFLRKSVTAVAIAAPVVALGAVTTAATASAAPGCPTPAARHIQGVPALIESAAIDSAGRLYVGDLSSRRVLRINQPGAAPQVVATISSGTGVGGVAIGPNDDLYVGGTNAAHLPAGDIAMSGTISVFSSAGTLKRSYSGFSASSGIAVASDGTAYATNDLGQKIGRANPDGSVNGQWARLASANGGVVSADGQWLYVSRSFLNPGVSRISTANPSVIENVWTAPLQYSVSAPDGLALAPDGGIVVPMNSTGQIVKVSGGSTCTLAVGLLASTQVVYGRGSAGFAAGHLYRVGFDGQIWEITSARG